MLHACTPAEFRPAEPAAFVDTPEGLEAMVAHLVEATSTDDASCRMVAVDVEAHSEHSFQGLTCLVQISSTERDFLVDTLALGPQELSPLNDILTDPSIVKLLHGCDRDIVWLQRCCGLYLVNVFDTGQAARTLQLQSFGLAHLLTSMAGVVPDKSMQRADWRRRPLPAAMLGYAAEDTRHLIPIAQRLINRLVAEGGGAAVERVLGASRELCMQTYTFQRYRGGPAARDLAARAGLRLSDSQGRALTALSDWRDLLARARDEAPHQILPKRALLRLAEALPTSLATLTAAVHPLPPAVSEHAEVLCRIVAEAKRGAVGGEWTPRAVSASASTALAGAGAGSGLGPATSGSAEKAHAPVASARLALVQVNATGGFVPDAGIVRTPSTVVADTGSAGRAAGGDDWSGLRALEGSLGSGKRGKRSSTSGPGGNARWFGTMATSAAGSGAGLADEASAVRSALASSSMLAASGVPVHLIAAAAASAASEVVEPVAPEVSKPAAPSPKVVPRLPPSLNEAFGPKSMAIKRASAANSGANDANDDGDGDDDEADEASSKDIEDPDGEPDAKMPRAASSRAELAGIGAGTIDAIAAGGSLAAGAMLASVDSATRALTSRNSEKQRKHRSQRQRQGGSDNPFLSPSSRSHSRGKGKRGRGSK
jgi:exosome complex exonuclease RRP6